MPSLIGPGKSRLNPSSALFVNTRVPAKCTPPVYCRGSLYFDSYKNGDLQWQEFGPRGADDIFGPGAACCRALPALSAAVLMYC